MLQQNGSNSDLGKSKLSLQPTSVFITIHYAQTVVSLLNISNAFTFKIICYKKYTLKEEPTF